METPRSNNSNNKKLRQCTRNSLIPAKMILPLILWIVIIVIVLPIAALITVPLVVWRVIVNCAGRLLRPDLVGRLSSRDLVFTSDSFYGKARKNVISCSITKGSMQIQDLRKRFRARILDRPEYFKLKCRPVLFLGYWFWQYTSDNVSSSYCIPHFDISDCTER